MVSVLAQVHAVVCAPWKPRFERNQPIRRVFRRYHPRENEFAWDLDGPSELDYERRLASLSRPASPEPASSPTVQTF